MTVRSPNPEQKVAIEHNGGVVLKAGAGSGKTFVLVEHLVYLIENRLSELSGSDEQLFETRLREFMSSIVVMTFTNKAAGELELRLKKRLQQCLDEQTDPVFISHWQKVKTFLPIMTVGTIHGFCFKVLSQGAISRINPQIEIISQAQAHARIDLLYRRWFEKKSVQAKSLKTSASAALRVMVANQEKVLKSLCDIFDSPSLRMLWENSRPKEFVAKDLNEFFRAYAEKSGWKSLLVPPDVYSWADKGEGKSWYKFSLEAKNNLEKGLPVDQASIKRWMEFFAGYKRLTKPRDPLDSVEFIDQLKELRKFLSDYNEDLLGFLEHKDGVFLEWLELFKELFDFINRGYSSVTGMTFADLEYFMLSGLREGETRKRLAQTYKYFIVDEFQDTSFVQYEILQLLCNGDSGRLFCVGDMKQAIYGFRGGEVGVFKEAMERSQNIFSMGHNYRSWPEVIEFNNCLFNALLPLGLDFKGLDEHAVDVDSQTVPELGRSGGAIYKLNVEVEGDRRDENGKKKKVTSNKLNAVEAEALFKHILFLKDQYPGETICLLYKNLGPSKFLLEKLLESNENFVAQIKVPFNEDPLICLFKVMLETFLEPDKCKALAHAEFLVAAHLRALSMDVFDNTSQSIELFLSDVETLGLEEAFYKFIFSLGLANSNHSKNVSAIATFCKTGKNRPGVVWEALKRHGSERYSIDFQSGGSSTLEIMTAHASKGLEFDHVILAGIHNNGKKIPDSSYFGKVPGSFRWKLDSNQSKPFRSPESLLERLFEAKKAFSESKRLFYVACTRAVKTLSWADISWPDSGELLGGSSGAWIDGLRAFERGKTSQKPKSRRIPISWDEKQLASETYALFHRDNMGLVQKSAPANLATLCELSVTRLASLCECPRKFYLGNICRFEADELEVIESVLGDDKRKQKNSWPKDTSENISSTAERGTRIHEWISEMIEHNLVVPRQVSGGKEQNGLEWVATELGPLSEKTQMVSERATKFSLFGHMISGTPDLVCYPDEESLPLQVWDFKTGARSQDKERPYWFQLIAYAYGLAGQQKLSAQASIELVLCYVDERRLLKQTMSVEDCRKFLYQEWKKLDDLSQVNLFHCSNCSYQTLCHL